MSSNATGTDSIEIGELVRTLRRGWRAIAGFTAMGIAAALAVILFAPRIYEGKASVVVRASTDGAAGLLSRLGNVGELLGESFGSAAPTMETELQVLGSRAIAARIVDSLGLQARVRSPRGRAPGTLVTSSDLDASFAPRTFSFARAGDGKVRVTGDDFDGELIPGQPGRIPIGTVTLRANDLPDQFTLKIYDREEAITRLQDAMNVRKAGGEVARITYRGEDPATAASVPNLAIAAYLERRKTTDRGTNTRRVEFLAAQVDSTAAELARAERALRMQQQASGVLDPMIVGRVELEQLAELRKALIEVQVEEAAINQLLGQVAAGTSSGRQLAAYPAFLRGASLNSLIAQLGLLEAERLKLLERRLENDPEVVALTQSIQSIEGQFAPMARSYASAMSRQRSDLQAQLDTMQRRLLSMPATAEAAGRMQRDVLRLSQIYAALQAQLVHARLAAVGEGGDVRQLDVARPPRKPWFPRPVVTMGIGFGGGLIAGAIAALILAWFGRWMHDEWEIERVTGVPTQRLGSGAPLLVVGTAAGPRTVLVIPLEERARAAGGAVAEMLVRTATSRALSATLLDLSHNVLAARSSGNGDGVATQTSTSAIIDDLEQRFGMVVVQLPVLASESTIAALRENRPVLLVAPPDRVDRVRLMSTVETLRRLQIPCAGIVVGNAVSAAS